MLWIDNVFHRYSLLRNFSFVSREQRDKCSIEPACNYRTAE